MIKDELLARLKGLEWNDVGFKLAHRGIPDVSHETVSAIALTQIRTAQVLVEPAQQVGQLFTLAKHLRGRIQLVAAVNGAKPDMATVQVTEQVAGSQTVQVAPLVQWTAVQWLIVNHADNPRKIQDLIEVTGYKQCPFFKATHLESLSDADMPACSGEANTNIVARNAEVIDGQSRQK